MERPAGITAAAVMAFIGSGFALLSGAFMIPLAMLAPRVPERTPPSAQVAILSGLFFFGLGAWGTASGIGLLHLKNWARISVLVFSGLLILSSLPPLAFFFFVPLPAPPNSPPALMTLMRAFFVVFYLLQIAVAVWWLIYFNRRSVREQFVGGSQAVVSTAPRPLLITILGWYLLIGGFTLVPIALLRFPAMILGRTLTGWPAAGIYLLYVLANLGSGVGLLCLKRSGFVLASCLFTFNLLNCAVLLVLPDREARLAAALQTFHLGTQFPNWNPVPFMWLGWLFGTVWAIALLTILFFARKAFLTHAHATKSGAPFVS